MDGEFLKAGQSLGRYELLQSIASGGMATVWAARLAGTRGFQKLVAIKAMLPELRDEPGAEAMFMREAGVVSRIRHPNVVEVFDVGEDKGVLFLVMEWIHGEPLSAVITAARAHGEGMPPAMAVRIGVQVCEGLHAAHELTDPDGKPTGLVHRDVSPHNILVGFNGIAKVTDFGIAKISEANETTRAGHVRGKVGYMAPEQVLLDPIDRRTDVFAAGIVLYVAATGRHPFRRKQTGETLRAVCEETPVAPSAIIPGFPRRLERVILRALEKTPDKRFGTAHEFGDELARALPPSTERAAEHELRKYVQGLLPHRLAAHSALMRHASTSKVAATSSSTWNASPAQSSSTLRAVAMSQAPEDGAHARPSDGSDSEEFSLRAKRRIAAPIVMAAAVLFGFAVGGLGWRRFGANPEVASLGQAAHGSAQVELAGVGTAHVTSTPVRQGPAPPSAPTQPPAAAQAADAGSHVSPEAKEAPALVVRSVRSPVQRSRPSARRPPPQATRSRTGVKLDMGDF